MSAPYLVLVRKQLVGHIRERSHGENQITPRTFYKEILPKFPSSVRDTVIRFCFEMTEIYTNKWVYLRLRPEWVDFDKIKENVSGESN